VQGQVAQPCVLAQRILLAPGPAPVTEFQVSELAALRAGDEAGEPVTVNIGETQLRAGVGAFLADDDPHPCRPAGKVRHAGVIQ
jgi:hypothetical protein